MSMFGRNKIVYHLQTTLCHFSCALMLPLLLSSYWGRKELPAERAKATLREALSTLQSGDLEGYMQYVDFAGEMDSMQRSLMLRLLAQHQDLRTQQKGALISIEALDADMQGDTVCTVFCQFVYADSTSEVVSQKMVRVGEKWKIRVRN